MADTAKKRVRAQRTETMQNAEILKAIAHPVRLCLAHQLAVEGPRSVTFFTDCMECSQSSISQHLAKMKSAGVVESERDGQSMVYRLKDERIRELLAVFWPLNPRKEDEE